MNIRHLLRMSNWARNPPSERRGKLVIATLVICLLIAGIEYLDLWPDWAKTQPAKLRP